MYERTGGSKRLLFIPPTPVPADPEGAVCISTTFRSRIAQGLRTHPSRFQIILKSPQTLCLIETYTLIKLII
jgi:hypothetical protein